MCQHSTGFTGNPRKPFRGGHCSLSFEMLAIRSFSTLIKQCRRVIASMASPSVGSQRQVACMQSWADSPTSSAPHFCCRNLYLCLHSSAVDQLIKNCLYSRLPCFPSKSREGAAGDYRMFSGYNLAVVGGWRVRS